MSESQQETSLYVPNLDKARNDAYFILSDSGQIKKKKINLQQLVRFHKAQFDTIRFANYDTLGSTGYDSDGDMTLKVSEKLSPLDWSFELATLLAMMVTYDAKTKLRKGRVYSHIIDENTAEPWLHAADVAMFILFYDVHPRELKVLHHRNSEKLISKLAQRKGLPTKHVLKRLSLEI